MQLLCATNEDVGRWKAVHAAARSKHDHNLAPCWVGSKELLGRHDPEATVTSILPQHLQRPRNAPGPTSASADGDFMCLLLDYLQREVSPPPAVASAPAAAIAPVSPSETGKKVRKSKPRKEEKDQGDDKATKRKKSRKQQSAAATGPSPTRR